MRCDERSEPGGRFGGIISELSHLGNSDLVNRSNTIDHR